MCNPEIDILVWCVGWVKTELHIIHYTNGTLWYEYFQNWVIVNSLSGKDTTQSSFSTDCDTPTTRYDRETLCEPVNGLPVSVRFEYLTDGTVSPAVAFNIDWTPYVWTISELVACWTQKQYDYEDTIVYDNCIAIMQTIVRETGNATNITTIFYTKLDWTAHTLVWPLSEKPCGSELVKLVDIDCVNDNPNVKECNSSAILTELQKINANTTASNSNENTIISLLWDLKLNTTGLALEATQQQVLTKATAIETLVTATNTKLDTLNITATNIKTSVDAVKTSVDLVKTAIQTLDTNNTTWLANVVTAVNTVNTSIIFLQTELTAFKNANHTDFVALNTLLQSEFDQTQTILQTEFDQSQALQTIANTIAQSQLNIMQAPCGDPLVQKVEVCTTTKIITSWGVSIAGWNYSNLMWPDWTNRNNPWWLKSITIRARKSNSIDTIPWSWANQVMIVTTNNKFILLTNETITYSVEDWNIQDIVSVECLKNSAALVIYNI